MRQIDFPNNLKKTIIGLSSDDRIAVIYDICRLWLRGGTARAALNLLKGADTVAISVYNAKGDKVDTIELGKQKEGVMEFGVGR